MAEWGTSQIAALASPKGLVGGPFGSTLGSKDYTQSGVPVIRGTNLDKGRFVGGDFVYVSETKVRDELARNVAVPGDLVFTQRGTLGQIAVVGSGGPNRFVVSQSQMRLRVDPGRADAMFVYYACSTEGFHKQVADHAIATGVPHINLGILSRLTIPLPPLGEQRAIADVLSALDEKIAANTRLLTVADDLVRAEWDSAVRVSAETVPLALLASAVRDQVKPSLASSGSTYVGLEHIPRRQMWLDSWGDADAVTSTKTRYAEGDVLFGKLRPYFHKVVSAPGAGICSTDIIVIRAHKGALAGFVLAAASSDAVVQWASSSSAGTRMPRTSWQDLSTVDIRWPGASAAGAFSARVDAIRAAAEARIRENMRLTGTRDALIPALMSGRLRVRDAQRDTAGRSQVG